MEIKGTWIRSELKVSPQWKQAPAPFYRKRFILKRSGRSILNLCTPCWHELYVNGKKVGDSVLSPVVMQFDKHIPVLPYDITSYLRKGENEISILLGHGWFASFEEDAWHFKHAPWNPHIWDSEKLLAELRVEGRVVMQSDSSWEYTATPIVFNSLRNGEVYDARLEGRKAEWIPVVAAIPPPGLPELEKIEPCRICEQIAPVAVKSFSAGKQVFDFGKNLTGWLKIAVKGNSGTEVILRYSELVDENGAINRKSIEQFVLSGEFQTDHYILSGKAKGEIWMPRFTYHGFRYVELEIRGTAKLISAEAQFIHTDFKSTGSFYCDNDDLNKLFRITVNTYLSNFIGIPTDCPHREKNGWTGDAHLAMETGLWNFDGHRAYEHFQQMVADTQTASGGVACIAPNSGWGNGINPPWDIAIFELPYQLRRFYGDQTVVNHYLPVMEKYWTFLASLGDLPEVGLGDWCSPVDNTRSVQGLISSAFFIWMSRFLEEETGKSVYAKQVSRSTKAFIKKYRHADGSWLNGEITPCSTALYFGLSPKPEKDLAYLVKNVRKNQHKAFFGIIGAKWTPRVLAENGYINDALEFFLQPEFPGWNNLLKLGATTLWESWTGNSSQNHIMFGDNAAWVYQYLGGIRPDSKCGFRRFELKPCIPEKLNEVKCSYRSNLGLIKSEWKKSSDGRSVKFRFSIPKRSVALVTLPGGKTFELKGSKSVTVSLVSDKFC